MFKSINLLVVMVIFFNSPCFGFILDDESTTTAVSKEIVDINRRLRKAKEDKVWHERHGLDGFYDMDNRTIADLEEKKSRLEDELLLNTASNYNQHHDKYKVNTEKRLELSKKVVDINKRLRNAKEDKASHERHGLDGFYDMDNRTIADLQEKKSILEDELLLLN